MAKDHAESWFGDSVLAQRLWDRYVGAPGVIPTGSALRLARRIAGAGRLPLLADIQRRWAPPDESWLHSGSALFYARPVFSAEPLPPAPGGDERLPQSARVETQLPRTRVVPSADNAGRVVQRETASPGSVGAQQSGGRQMSLPRVSDPAQAVAAADLGAAIVQRYRGAPIGRVMQAASSESVRLSRPRVLEQSGLPHPRVGGVGDYGELSRAAAPAVILDRASLSGPVELSSGQATRVQRADAEPARTTGRPLVRPPSRPSGESGSPVTPAAGSDPGAAVVQRHQNTPVGQAPQVQRVGVEPVDVVDRPAVRLSPRSIGELKSPGMQTSSTAQARSVAPAIGGNLGTALVQRHLGGPVHHAASGVASEHPSVGPSPPRSGVESEPPVAQAELAAPGAAIGDLGVTIMQRHLNGPVGRAGEERRLTVVPEPVSVVRQGVAALQRSPVPGIWRGTMSTSSSGWGTLSPRAEPRVGVAPGRAEMPLARTTERGGALRTGNAASSIVVQRAFRPLDMPPPAAEPREGAPPGGAGEPEPASTAPRPGFEGIDLERLADEVYTIIERRLIVERESRGL